MQETCPCGSVRGAPGNWRLYRDSTMTEEMVGGQHRNDEATRAERVGWTRVTRDDGQSPARARCRACVWVCPMARKKRFKETKKMKKPLDSGRPRYAPQRSVSSHVPLGRSDVNVSCLSWKWRRRSSVSGIVYKAE